MIIPIKKDGNWSCTNCGQFFLDRTWSYCPICGEPIHWAQAEYEERTQKIHQNITKGRPFTIRL